MHLHARVRGEPGPHLDAFVRGVVVHHQVQLAVGIGLRDLLEEPQELLVPMPWLRPGGHLAGGDLQRREQRGGAVPAVVVGAPLGQPKLHRQHRGGAVQRLRIGRVRWSVYMILSEGVHT